MITITQLNDFVIKHTAAQYFEADVKLYKKHFPNSKLIPELDRAPEFAKKPLDERIIYELLNNQDSCIDCIWENRGFAVDGDTVIPISAAPKKPEEKQPANKTKKAAKPVIEKPVKKIVLKPIPGMSYNDLKKAIFDLGLDTSCANHKAATYRSVLENYNTPVAPATDSKKKEGLD